MDHPGSGILTGAQCVRLLGHPGSGILTGAQCVRLFPYSMADTISHVQVGAWSNYKKKVTANNVLLCFEATITFTDGTRKICAFRFMDKGAGRDVYDSAHVPFVAKLVDTKHLPNPNVSEHNIFAKWAHRCENLIPRILFHLKSVTVPQCGEFDILFVQKAGVTFRQYVQQVMDDEKAGNLRMPDAKFDICRAVVGVCNLWHNLPIELEWEKDMHSDNIALSSSGATWWWIDWADAEKGDPRLNLKYMWALLGSNKKGKNCLTRSLCCISQPHIFDVRLVVAVQQ